MGNRQKLKDMGWGLALLYVGQQASLTVCAQVNQTEDQGRVDARDAVAQASDDGFPADTNIFLDQEPVDTVPLNMLNYCRGWFDEMLKSANPNYRPAIYCHVKNAQDIYDAVIDIFRIKYPAEQPAFWVTGGSNFDTSKAPTESGLSFANIWQGILDTNDSHGGVSIGIDISVADSSNPSNA